MNSKKLAFALGFSAALGIMVACNESSTSANDDDTKVSSAAEEITSSDSDAGSTEVQSSESKVESSASEDVTSSESKEEASSSESKVQDLLKCEGDATKDTVIAGVTMSAVCKNGQWVPSEESSELAKNFLKCDTEGDTKDTVVAGVTISAVCKDGQWTTPNREDLEKQFENMFTCTEEEEGQTKEIEMAQGVSMEYTCTKGAWTPKSVPLGDSSVNLGDLFGKLGGDSSVNIGDFFQNLSGDSTIDLSKILDARQK
jgi:hypothetical protein